MAEDFSVELDTFELLDLIEAMDDWEHRQERELSYLKELVENVVFPRDAPEEARVAFDAWVKKQRRRIQELQNNVPDRKERATLIKTKLIIKKRNLAKVSEAALEQLPPSDEPPRKRHPELD